MLICELLWLISIAPALSIHLGMSICSRYATCWCGALTPLQNVMVLIHRFPPFLFLQTKAVADSVCLNMHINTVGTSLCSKLWDLSSHLLSTKYASVYRGKPMKNLYVIYYIMTFSLRILNIYKTILSLSHFFPACLLFLFLPPSVCESYSVDKTTLAPTTTLLHTDEDIKEF